MRFVEQLFWCHQIYTKLVTQGLLFCVQLPFDSQVPQELGISAFEGRLSVDSPVKVLPDEDITID